MNTENNQKLSYIDTLYLAIAEGIVALAVTAAFIILGLIGVASFDYTVVLGALLGGAVTVLNFFILSVSINRAVAKYIEARGKEELSEEEAEEFSKKHGMDVQNAMTKSYILRTVLMAAALVAALFTKLFNPIATVIPLLMYRPIIYVIELIKTKLQGRRGG